MHIRDLYPPNVLKANAEHVLKTLWIRDRALLDNNMSMAKDELINDLSFGRKEFEIPEQHFEVIKLIYPDLIHVDPDVQEEAWAAFRKSPHSTPYKVNAKEQSKWRPIRS